MSQPIFRGMTVLFVCILAGTNVPSGLAGAGGWTTHNDAAGFSVDAPADWNIATDRQSGRITVLGKRGEQAIIWPMFVAGQRFDSRGASVVVQQLARKIDAAMPWSAPEVSANAVRVMARGRQRSGATWLTWATRQNGTAIYLYNVEAPPDVYRASVDTFATILKSFHVVQTPTAKDGGTPTKNALGQTASFVRWTDPRENAFHVSVPQGWKVIGGAYRLTATDVRTSVQLLSPDNQVRISVGDANIGAFTQPTPMLSQFGYREGSYQVIGDGSKLEVRRFLTGRQFAHEYADRLVQKECSNLRVVSNNDRQDLASNFHQQAQAEGMSSGQISAGDISFTCSLNGREVGGYYAVATIVPLPGRAPLWYVYRLYGFLAPSERQQDTTNITRHIVESWEVDPQWREKERQIAAAAVQQDNQRSQEIQRRALAAIAEDQRQTSEMITSSYWNRQKTYDEISRKRENAILGTVDVVDPGSGAQYKIDYSADYHWMNNQGYIVGTQTDTAPSVGWRKMIDLP